MFKRQDIQNLHQEMQEMQQTQLQFEAQRPVHFETILLQYLMWMEITRVLPNARLHFQCTSYRLSLLPPVCHPISYCKLAVRQRTTLETKLRGQGTDSRSLVVRLYYVKVSLLIWSAYITKKSLFHSAFDVFQDGRRKDWQALLDGRGIQHHGYIIHSRAATGAHNESTLPHHSSCFQFFHRSSHCSRASCCFGGNSLVILHSTYLGFSLFSPWAIRDFPPPLIFREIHSPLWWWSRDRPLPTPSQLGHPPTTNPQTNFENRNPTKTPATENNHTHSRQHLHNAEAPN